MNAAALRSGSVIRLDGSAGTIDGVAVRFANIEHAIGGDGDDTLVGSDEDNQLIGMRGGDRIVGHGGDDALHGHAGDDALTGGSGSDFLVGGAGNDRFRFRAIGDSPAEGGNQDVLGGSGGAAAFGRPGGRSGDLIVLRGIDANETRNGNQAFVLDDRGRLGTLALVDADGTTRVLGYTDADPEADFRIDIEDGARFAAADYGARDFIF